MFNISVICGPIWHKNQFLIWFIFVSVVIDTSYFSKFTAYLRSMSSELDTWHQPTSVLTICSAHHVYNTVHFLQQNLEIPRHVERKQVCPHDSMTWFHKPVVFPSKYHPIWRYIAWKRSTYTSITTIQSIMLYFNIFPIFLKYQNMFKCNYISVKIRENITSRAVLLWNIIVLLRTSWYQMSST